MAANSQGCACATETTRDLNAELRAMSELFAYGEIWLPVPPTMNDDEAFRSFLLSERGKTHKFIVSIIMKKIDRKGVEQFVATGGDVNGGLAVYENENDPTYKCATALMYAAFLGQTDVVTCLLENGAKVSTCIHYKRPAPDPSAFGGSALYWAALTGKYECCRVLLDHRAPIIDGYCRGGSPLFACTLLKTGDARVFKLLYGAGACMNERNEEGKTVLMQACYSARTDIVTYILQLPKAKRPDINACIRNCDMKTKFMDQNPGHMKAIRGMHALAFAVLGNAPECCRALCTAGADVNELAGARGNALLIALRHQHTEIAKILIENGATTQYLHSDAEYDTQVDRILLDGFIEYQERMELKMKEKEKEVEATNASFDRTEEQLRYHFENGFNFKFTRQDIQEISTQQRQKKEEKERLRRKAKNKRRAQKRKAQKQAARLEKQEAVMDAIDVPVLAEAGADMTVLKTWLNQYPTPVQSEIDEERADDEKEVKRKRKQRRNRKCNQCGKLKMDGIRKLYKCDHCKVVYYCGRDCQKEDWQRHKETCMRSA